MIRTFSRSVSRSTISISCRASGSSASAGVRASSTWIEPEIAASGIADLVRDARRELADRREPLRASQLALHLDHVRHVLEDHDVTGGRSLGVLQHVGAEAQVQALAALARVGRAHARLRRLGIHRARERELTDARQHDLDVATQHGRRGAAGDALGLRIERGDAARRGRW